MRAIPMSAVGVGVSRGVIHVLDGGNVASANQESLPGAFKQVILREIAGVFLFVVAAFLLLSFTSFVDTGAGQGDGGGGANLCGAAGFAVARVGLFWFGYGAYLGVFILFTWSLALIGRRTLEVGPFRLLWFGIFLFCASGLMSHFGTGSPLRIPDPGGLVGLQISRFLETTVALGPWGTKLVLLMLVLVTFQLATDFALYDAIVGIGAFLDERRQRAGEMVRSAGPLFSSLLRSSKPREAVATAGGAGSATEPRRPRRRAKREVEIVATDADVEGFDAPDGESDEESDESGRRTRRSRAERHAPQVDAEVDVWDEELPQLPGVASDEAEVEDVEADVAEAEAGEQEEDESAEFEFDDSEVEVEDDAEENDDESVELDVDGPPMLEEDPDSEVDPTGQVVEKTQATIRLEPPKEGPPRAAGFDREATIYEPPPKAEDYEYVFPSIELLERPRPVVSSKEFQKMIELNIEVLEKSLASYKVEAEVVEIQKGPVITMFEMDVAPGTRVDKIRSLEDDLAIRLKAPSVRIVAPIPGKSTIGIEVPNAVRETVCLRELVTSSDYHSQNYAIPVFLGKDAAGRPLIEDLAKMPHALIAGATGAGKSVCLNTLIMSVLYTRTPDQVKMILIDPKMVELSLFENIPHLMCPVVRDMNRAAQILEWAVSKMDERYAMLADVGARNIFGYNKIDEATKREKLNVPADDEEFESRMPFIIIVVDELADLMMVSAKEVENYITRLAQKSRAVGIHIILATQRPSTNVITGLIKANMPTRVSFQVASKIDSRVVLDQNGAEKLLGAGDMLYMPPRTSMIIRSQGAFITDDEIKNVVEAVKTASPLYAPELVQKNVQADQDPREVDDLYELAVRFIMETKRGSASLLQRKFAIGYTRASRLIDLMAEDGILGEYRNAQAREVLMTVEDYDERNRARDE